MRSFNRFIQRRRIQDVNLWLKNHNITSDEQLRQWCERENVKPPDRKYFKDNNSSAAVGVLPEAKDEKTEAWHVPAADRPLKKSKAKRRNKTTSRTTKSKK